MAGRSASPTSSATSISSTGILDFERGREDRLTPYPWLTDTSVGPWFHREAYEYRSLDELIDLFVDIVSKNGCLLLNVGPRSDGTIPEKAPGNAAGHGRMAGNQRRGDLRHAPVAGLRRGANPRCRRRHSASGQEPHYTSADIRFTTKGDALYAFALAWPKDGKLQIRSLAADAGKVTAVSLLGHAGELTWTQTGQALEVALPTEKPWPGAFVLKIQRPATSGLAEPDRTRRPIERRGGVRGQGKGQGVGSLIRLETTKTPAPFTRFGITAMISFVVRFPLGLDSQKAKKAKSWVSVHAGGRGLVQFSAN